MKSQVLQTVWCEISGGAVGEPGHWSLLRVKELRFHCRCLPPRNNHFKIGGAICYWIEERRFTTVTTVPVGVVHIINWAKLSRAKKLTKESVCREVWKQPLRNVTRVFDTQGVRIATQKSAVVCCHFVRALLAFSTKWNLPHVYPIKTQSSKSTFSKAFKEKCICEVVRIGTI